MKVIFLSATLMVSFVVSLLFNINLYIPGDRWKVSPENLAAENQLSLTDQLNSGEILTLPAQQLFESQPVNLTAF
jgi:hypothetical protein